MDLYFMARPHLAYYPANGAAHTLTYTNEVALLSTNSTPAAVPGTYIIKVRFRILLFSRSLCLLT
jgi:hypothetical protein